MTSAAEFEIILAHTRKRIAEQLVNRDDYDFASLRGLFT